MPPRAVNMQPGSSDRGGDRLMCQYLYDCYVLINFDDDTLVDW